LALLLAYGLSNLVPLIWYAAALRRHVRAAAPQSPAGVPQPVPLLRQFAWWSWLRLMLVMAFGFVSSWGFLYLVRQQFGGLDASANFSMAYRIAQMLAFAAAAFWASGYGIAAWAWAHGARGRARVTLWSLGQVGGAGLLVLAAMVTLGRSALTVFMRASYGPAIHWLLPPLLAVFLWYAMLGLLTLLGDLEERPWIGAAAWAVATLVQIGLIAACPISGLGAAEVVIFACAVGMASGLLVAGGLLWLIRRRMRGSAALVVVGVAGLVFFLHGYWLSCGALIVLLGSAGTLIQAWRHRRINPRRPLV
jgi:hypothetical protein